MTTGSTDNVDATLLRDLARAGGPEGLPPEHATPAQALADKVDDLYDQLSKLRGERDEFAAYAAQVGDQRQWIETVLDRVPEAYGDLEKPEAVIDRWLDDLVNVYDAVGYWRAEYQLGRAGVAMPSTYKAASESLAAAFDRVRTDEEGETDG